MKRLLVFFAILSITGSVSGQKTINGKITYKDSLPVVGATVSVKNSRFATKTNFYGSFTLQLSDSLIKAIDTLKLVVAYVGYITTEKTIDKNSSDSISVVLDAQSALLNDIVVIGYDAVRKGYEGQYVSFPWPPPDCSARALLNRSYFSKAATLGDADSILTTALKTPGYTDISYYYIPDGFALVTRIEQIDVSGESAASTDRWNVQTRPMKKLSWSGYLRSFFFSTPGYFRIIVFTVTDKSFSSSGKKIKREAAMNWLDSGMVVLPEEIKARKFNKDYNCVALIYEYEKPESAEAYLVKPGLLTADEHLKKSKIMDALKR